MLDISNINVTVRGRAFLCREKMYNYMSQNIRHTIGSGLRTVYNLSSPISRVFRSPSRTFKEYICKFFLSVSSRKSRSTNRRNRYLFEEETCRDKKVFLIFFVDVCYREARYRFSWIRFWRNFPTYYLCRYVVRTRALSDSSFRSSHIGI